MLPHPKTLPAFDLLLLLQLFVVQLVVDLSWLQELLVASPAALEVVLDLPCLVVEPHSRSLPSVVYSWFQSGHRRHSMARFSHC